MPLCAETLVKLSDNYLKRGEKHLPRAISHSLKMANYAGTAGTNKIKSYRELSRFRLSINSDKTKSDNRKSDNH